MWVSEGEEGLSDKIGSGKTYKCPYCTCIFYTRIDYSLHMAAFGDNQEMHTERLRRITRTTQSKAYE